MHITSMAFHTDWSFVVSAKSIEEITQTTDEAVRGDLLD